jgi:broad specificity phosphatase PhoE
LAAPKRRHARQRGKQQGVTFDLVIASPLIRARETAEVMVRAFATPIELDPDWMEMDNGP